VEAEVVEPDPLAETSEEPRSHRASTVPTRPRRR
jgi:hypothetical protein